MGYFWKIGETIMGWKGEISTLEELEALMCGNVLPAAKYPDAYYRLPRMSAVKRLITYATEIVLMSGGAIYE